MSHRRPGAPDVGTPRQCARSVMVPSSPYMCRERRGGSDLRPNLLGRRSDPPRLSRHMYGEEGTMTDRAHCRGVPTSGAPGLRWLILSLLCMACYEPVASQTDDASLPEHDAALPHQDAQVAR